MKINLCCWLYATYGEKNQCMISNPNIFIILYILAIGKMMQERYKILEHKKFEEINM